MGMLVRFFRIFRLLRSFRFVRFLRLVPELRTLVHSMARSVKAFIWTCAILVLLIYVFGVYLAQLVIDHDQGLPGISDPKLHRYFGGLSVSMLSLFQAISGGGVDWNDLVSPLR